MPNTAFDPVRLSGRILRQLRMSLVTDSIVNRNWQGDIEGPEDTVEILELDALTVNDYDTSSGITVETEPSGNTRQLTLPHKKYFAFIADLTDNAEQYMDMFSDEGMADLMRQAQQYVLGKASGPPTHQEDVDATGSLSGDDIKTALQNIGVKLDNAEVPADGRYAVLRPQEYNLVEDDLMERDTELGDDVIRNGYQGMYQGFEIYKAPDSHFTNTGTSPSYDHCPVGSRLAITYADAIVNTRVQESERYFGQQVDGLHVAGAKVVRPDALADFRVQVA